MRVTPSASVYLRVSANTPIQIIRTKRIGIRILLDFSIPLFTPPKTITAVAITNTAIKIIGTHKLVI